MVEWWIGQIANESNSQPVSQSTIQPFHYLTIKPIDDICKYNKTPTFVNRLAVFHVEPKQEVKFYNLLFYPNTMANYENGIIIAEENRVVYNDYRRKIEA